MLTVQTRNVAPDVAVVEVTGRICIGRDCQQLEWQVNELIQKGTRKLVLDLTNVTHMDSTGIGILVSCSGKMRVAGGELRVAGATGAVEKVIKLTQVDNIVPLFPTAAAATENFRTAPA
ncbi:MAG TPA: STAS domain-containing protein [Terriglobales bacterium]|nr:STAS domain-containing protein [Terriglobales bacterium]